MENTRKESQKDFERRVLATQMVFCKLAEQLRLPYDAGTAAAFLCTAIQILRANFIDSEARQMLAIAIDGEFDRPFADADKLPPRLEHEARIADGIREDSYLN